jgi:hypothetical protein
VDPRRDIIRFKISLKAIRPSIWRRIEVPARYSFWDLHVAIQDAMGWVDYHLHEFRVRNARGQIDEVGIPNDDAFEGEPPILPGWKVQVADYFDRIGARATYEYDFGDSWIHDLRVEAIGPRAPRVKYPRCVAGARRCPPEDCGGPSGYAELLTVIADPSHEEHASTLQWLGGPIDPAAFDVSAVQFDDPAERWKTAFAGG